MSLTHACTPPSVANFSFVYPKRCAWSYAEEASLKITLIAADVGETYKYVWLRTHKFGLLLGVRGGACVHRNATFIHIHPRERGLIITLNTNYSQSELFTWRTLPIARGPVGDKNYGVITSLFRLMVPKNVVYVAVVPQRSELWAFKSITVTYVKCTVVTDTRNKFALICCLVFWCYFVVCTTKWQVLYANFFSSFVQFVNTASVKLFPFAANHSSTHFFT